jgi:hypothetical protein
VTKTQDNQSKKFFTPWQFYAASCLGTPLAAMWLAVVNYRVFQQPKKIKYLLLFGLIATTVVIAPGYVLPSAWWTRLWPFIYSFGIYYFARRFFEKEIIQGIAQGMQRSAWWRVFLISFGFFVIVIAVVFALQMIFTEFF